MNGQPKPDEKKLKSPLFKRRVLWIFVVLVLSFLTMEGILLISGAIGNSLLRTQNPDTSAFIQKFEIASKKKVSLSWKKLGQISRNLVRAVIVAEDDAFFEHQGLDMEEMKESWKVNWEKKSIVRGGSTITMQLVKNLYLSGRKSPLRKINEILLAFDMENKVPKKRILEVYLNIAQWGYGIYGAEAASQHYFGKSASSLTPSEAAYLAALLPNPVYLSVKGAQRARRSQARILRRMQFRRIPKNL